MFGSEIGSSVFKNIKPRTKPIKARVQLVWFRLNSNKWKNRINLIGLDWLVGFIGSIWTNLHPYHVEQAGDKNNRVGRKLKRKGWKIMMIENSWLLRWNADKEASMCHVRQWREHAWVRCVPSPHPLSFILCSLVLLCSMWSHAHGFASSVQTPHLSFPRPPPPFFSIK